ncbi:MAG: tetratricopeptide repeat protein [Candidatus Korobacteraceae bacterium]
MGERRVRLSGRVLNSHGAPVADASVSLLRVRTGQVIASTSSLPDGSYEITNIPSGQYVVTIVSGLHQTQQEVTLTDALDGELNFQIAAAEDGPVANGSATVSVAQLQVPKKARKLLNEAQEAYEDGKREEAIHNTEQALAEFPDFSEALAYRAMLYMEDRQGEEARSLLERAVAVDPNYGMGYVILGSAYNMLTRFDDALRVLKQAFSYAPQSWQRSFEAARAYLGKEEYAKSLEQVNRAAQYAPSRITAIYLLRAQSYLGMHNYAAATANLSAYLKEDPDGVYATQAQKLLDSIQIVSQPAMAAE